MSKYVTIIAVVATMFCVQQAQAQFIREQSKLVGVVGCLNLDAGNTFYFGANFEYMMKRDIGVGAVLRYFNSVVFHYVPVGTKEASGPLVGLQANYHFKVAQSELDPVFGLILGMKWTTISLNNVQNKSGQGEGTSSEFVFAIQAGARYFLNEKLAATGRLCFGSHYNAIDLGMDLSL